MSIQIVLANPSHPGNIGAAARAMKTMGLAKLTLINPKIKPNDESYARATHAVDLLDNCKIFPELAPAIADSTLVIGTSARPRHLAWPIITPNELKDICALHPKTSIIFGNERTGLTNQEISLCHKLMHIPTNPDCPSLNLAAAVQIVAYELNQLKTAVKKQKTLPASNYELQCLFEHLSVIMQKTDFCKPNSSNNLMQKIKCLFQRAEPLATEIAILRGILTSIERKLP